MSSGCSSHSKISERVQEGKETSRVNLRAFNRRFRFDDWQKGRRLRIGVRWRHVIDRIRYIRRNVHCSLKRFISEI